MAPTDRIVGYAELAEITGKSPRTLRRWFFDKRLRRVKRAGVVGCWESELIVALGWRGGPSGLVSDDPCDRPDDDNDASDDLLDDDDADAV